VTNKQLTYRKLGLVRAPDGSPLQRQHAILPTPWFSDAGLRVFYASTDADLVGRVFWIDLDPENPVRIVGESPVPALDAGQVGTFDMHGVNAISVVPDESGLRLYYAGYHRGTGVPYTLFTGLAHSVDGGASFSRVSRTPVLDRTDQELFFRTAAHVARMQDRWEAWYIGGGAWTEFEGKSLPLYGLRHTTSADGVIWSAPTTLLDPDPAAGQIGFGRPSLLPDQDGHRLFLSVRTVRGYTLSHATTPDGLEFADWQHDVLPVSGSGWDSEMICYGTPLLVEDREFLFYNGNRFGWTGFGVAERV
jgi:hypothetical protein